MRLAHLMPACHMGLSCRETFRISARPGGLADHRIGKQRNVSVLPGVVPGGGGRLAITRRVRWG